MNRPTTYPTTESVWEDGAEAAFFDTLEPPPVREDLLPAQTDTHLSYGNDEATVQPISSATPKPIDFGSERQQATSPTLSPPVVDAVQSPPRPPENAAQPSEALVLDEDPVLVVTPRWVWPTVGLFAMLAVGGMSFGLGVWAAAGGSSSAAVAQVAPADTPDATVAAAPVVEEVETAPRAKTQPPKKVTKPRVRTPSKARTTSKSTPSKSVAPKRAARTSPEVAAVEEQRIPGLLPKPKTPASVADLPAAVSLGSMRPGAAL